MTGRRRYLLADLLVMANCAFSGVAFAAAGSLTWALVNLACFTAAGIDGCRQARRLRAAP